ncbi:hypothetical protein NDU88_010403 [Pleurodeles waltl]|uniref:RNase H type-1 domain-containing protein n=1 Tax=Pleurodeles waltl TaxID=8319 RepID=A0AAV7QXX2_PLEWA|nr:hypothetical protein NDU88_010403 [Pleurodeles waltl]
MVFATLYTTTHSTLTLANPLEVLKQIQDESGAALALDLGMQLIGNFDTVSSIILSNLKEEAVTLAVHMRLRDIPPQDQECELPKIIAETYSSIGQDSLGTRPTKPQFQVVSGYIEGNKFYPQHTFTQTLGDCTAQLAELKALVMSLEHTDPAQLTLIVCDFYYCVQSFNEYLHYWCQNGLRDSKGNTIKHRVLWGKVADLKETLSNVHVVHTFEHQRVGIHVARNTLADQAAKSAAATASVAAVTRPRTKPDKDIWAAVKATAEGTPLPKAFPDKYSYQKGGFLDVEVKIPDVGV